jgi:hypothetical protein
MSSLPWLVGRSATGMPSRTALSKSDDVQPRMSQHCFLLTERPREAIDQALPMAERESRLEKPRLGTPREPPAGTPGLPAEDPGARRRGAWRHSRAKRSRPGGTAARAPGGAWGVESPGARGSTPVAAISAHGCEVAPGGSGMTRAAPAQAWVCRSDPWGSPRLHRSRRFPSLTLTFSRMLRQKVVEQVRRGLAIGCK